MSGPHDRAAACATALAGLPGMGPATLVRILSDRGPEEAWAAVCSGGITRPGRRRPPPGAGPGPVSPLSPGLPWDGAGPEVVAPGPDRTPWTVAARRVDPDDDARAHRAAGIQVTWWGDRRYPPALVDDPEPPGVLFWRGELGWLGLPTVALVGTRRCTPDGRVTAFELGRDLAAAGVCVVSGLALGIDGAAHAGALAMAGEGDGGGAGTVGVAASGVDVVYPPAHRGLWSQVVRHGAVCSETPPGRPAQAWRFPARNRVIAALSRMVVVVESHRAGGSLITVEAALRRGIEVRAVPGPVRSPASVGSNQLLADGPAPVRHAGDVLDALGTIAAWPPPDRHLRPRRPVRRPPPPGASGTASGSCAAPARGVGPVRRAGAGAHSAVLEAVGWRPSTVNQVVEASGLPLPVVDAALDALLEQGLVTVSSSWWSRTDPG
jgi:DNA processing protein